MSTMQDPARNAAPIVLDADITGCQSLYVGGAGNVAVEMVGGAVVTFSSVPAGTTLLIRARRVNTTNTTASNMIALL